MRFGSRLPALVVAVGLVATALVTQAAWATHARPKGATPVRVSLVPAFNACTVPNTSHGPPLSFPSCNPPPAASSFLTVGVRDANGNGPAPDSVGSIRIDVKPGAPGPPEDSDLIFKGSITDVRCLPAEDPSVCSSPNAAGGPDYSGELQSNATIRITDHFNGPSGAETATVRDIPFPINLFCVNTASVTTGGACSVTSSGAVVCPECGIQEGNRTLVEITQFEVFDGGPDGQVGTADGSTVFARQGLFIP